MGAFHPLLSPNVEDISWWRRNRYEGRGSHCIGLTNLAAGGDKRIFHFLGIMLSMQAVPLCNTYSLRPITRLHYFLLYPPRAPLPSLSMRHIKFTPFTSLRTYRVRIGSHILLSNSQAVTERKVKQEQVEISCNHLVLSTLWSWVKALFPGPVHIGNRSS